MLSFWTGNGVRFILRTVLYKGAKEFADAIRQVHTVADYYVRVEWVLRGMAQ